MATAGAESLAPPIESVVIIATRIPQEANDLPVSIDKVGSDQIQRSQLRVNLSESLVRVPGLVVQNRQNYAQDLQISSRGFGARSTFGVRGLRLYADGIPATMPDGQGQVSHFDLGSANRIEVMRGPFSALYGNSSGGVIALFSEDGGPGRAMDVDMVAGSYGTLRSALKFSGDTGRINYVFDAVRFAADGFRQHSAVRRDNLNAKLRTELSSGTRVSLVANSVDMPEAEDPLGLTRSQYETNPEQAGVGTLAFDTRKSVRQNQLGLSLRQPLDGSDEVSAEFYGGQRESRQFQSIPIATQLPLSSPGGVIDLERAYWGSDMRWTRRDVLWSGPTVLVAGLNYENLNEQRKGFQNFTGSHLGVLGALRRNESNAVHNFDQYVQFQWQAAEAWLLHAGLRRSIVRVNSRDRYIVAGNGDDSGMASYAATTPVAGVSWRVDERTRLYISTGRGFETPTLNELSYRSVSATSTGLNFGLRPSRSQHFELGVKAKPADAVRLNAALFRVKTKDELAVQQNSGGRSVFQNVGSTQRQGFELSYGQQWQNGLAATVAYTYLKAEYSDGFLSCAAPPCSVPTLRIPAGNRMPGIPESSFYGELRWHHRPAGLTAAIEMRSTGSIQVDDANSDAAPAYMVANFHLELEQGVGEWRFREYLRIDNLTDRRYAGSVIVNEGNKRFFEPAPGRNAMLGLNIHTAW